jgi:hypothetical protein
MKPITQEWVDKAEGDFATALQLPKEKSMLKTSPIMMPSASIASNA